MLISGNYDDDIFELINIEPPSINHNLIFFLRTDNKMSSKTSKKGDMKEKLIEKDKNKKKSNLI
jgi:hypothetical protein